MPWGEEEHELPTGSVVTNGVDSDSRGLSVHEDSELICCHEIATLHFVLQWMSILRILR